MSKITKEQLIAFETEICGLFNQGLIKAPIHLYHGNEDKMIEIFENVKSEDWVFCSWRSHYQCLLKGVDPEIMKQDILAGKSIALSYPSHHIYSSAIVTGSIPISVGVALDIKLKKRDLLTKKIESEEILDFPYAEPSNYVRLTPLP